MIHSYNNKGGSPFCPGCGHKDFSLLYEIIWDRPISVVLCHHCALGFQLDPLSEYELVDYYSKHSVFHLHGKESRQNNLVKTRHKFLEPYISSLEKLQSRRTVLDAGCGYGDFLSTFNSKVWTRLGFEINPDRASYAREEYGIIIEEKTLEKSNVQKNSVDLLCAFGLIEHLLDPRRFLKSVSSVLKKTGLGCVNVPDTLNPLIAISEFFSVEHVLYFTQNTLKALLESCGFSILKIGTVTPDYPDTVCLFERSFDNGATYSQENILANPSEVDRIKAVVDKYRRTRKKLIESIRQRLTKSSVFSSLPTVAIYGAGEHTRNLLLLIPEFQSTKVFFDSDPKKWGSKLLNGVVYPINEINNLNVDKIIISSRAFEDEIGSFLSKAIPKHVQALRLYS